MSFSAAGTVLAFNVASPKFANLAPGNAYAIIISNQTAAEVDAGTLTIEGADASANDPCVPGAFAPLKNDAFCAPLDPAAPNATYDLAANPIAANAQCAVAVACPKQFIRVTGVGATGLELIAVVTRLKRTGL